MSSIAFHLFAVFILLFGTIAYSAAENNADLDKFLEDLSGTFFDQLLGGSKANATDGQKNQGRGSNPIRAKRHGANGGNGKDEEDPLEGLDSAALLALAQKKLNDHRDVYIRCFQLTHRQLDYLAEMKRDPWEAHKIRSTYAQIVAMRSSLCTLAGTFLWEAKEAAAKSQWGEEKMEIVEQILKAEAEIQGDCVDIAKLVAEVKKLDKKKRGK